MSKKLTSILLGHVIVLLISVIAINIVNYVTDGGWTSIIIMMCVLIPQLLFVLGIIFYKMFNKHIIKNWFLIMMFIFEAIGIALVGCESLQVWLPVIGYALLYLTIAINWVVLLYYNGTWGKYEREEQKEPTK